MSPAEEVLERSVVHAGKVFIKAGKENSRAYMIQKGMVRSFIIDDGEKIEVERYGPGTVIGEVCLVVDTPLEMSYEAIVDTTVIITTRQDFEKKLNRADKTIKTVINHVMEKLSARDSVAIKNARDAGKIDEETFLLVQGLTAGLPPDKKFQYEEAILPHMNGLVKAVKKLKEKERHLKQENELGEKVSKLKESE